MLSIHISKALLTNMSHLLDDTPPATHSLQQWYAHQVMISGEPCVILMEAKSRYALVMCGMTDEEFGLFPEIFRERLWQNVMAICPVEMDDDIALLSNLVLDAADEQAYLPGFDRSVMGHITQVVDHLRYMVEEEGYPLPSNDRDAILFGLHVNEDLRKTRLHKDYFVPIREFSKFWMEKLHSTDTEPLPQLPPMTAGKKVPDNVIHVNFLTGKRQPL